MFHAIVMCLFQVQGTFRVNAPPVLLGYTHDSRGRGPGGDMEVDIGLGDRGQTYLSMYITIEPLLIPPEPVKERVCTDDIVLYTTIFRIVSW